MGLSRSGFRAIGTQDHLAQSIADILTTPIGSRVRRRDYGSRLPDLIDAPMNGETVVELYHATAEALDRWEPRFALERVEILAGEAGRMDLALYGEILGEAARLEVAVA